MGKYMRKARAAGGVAVMEMSQGPLGVRTRARALALENNSKNSSHSAEASAEWAHPEPEQISYLELRSRRLEKFVGCGSRKEELCNSKGASRDSSERRLSDVTNSDVLDDCSSRLVRHEEVGQGLTMLDASKVGDRGRNNLNENRGGFLQLEEDVPQKLLCAGLNRSQSRGMGHARGAAHSENNSRSNSIPLESSEGILTRNQSKLERRDSPRVETMLVDAETFCSAKVADNVGIGSGRNTEVEVSFGENPVDDGSHVTSVPFTRGYRPAVFRSNHNRLVRESTPCSHVREAEDPGSEMSLALGHGHDTRFMSPVLLDPQALLELEIDEFFANADRLEQRRFTDRYNFDPVNDVPLPGRFEWIKLQPSL